MGVPKYDYRLGTLRDSVPNEIKMPSLILPSR